MSRSIEQKKKVDNFADSSFLCDSGDENNTFKNEEYLISDDRRCLYGH